MEKKQKIELPKIDIFTDEYIRVSKMCDRCSCSPDTIHGVYIGNACKHHDENYEYISSVAEQLNYFSRLKLKWNADQQLHDDIKEICQRAGHTLDSYVYADIYKFVVVKFNIIFRIFKAITLQTL